MAKKKKAEAEKENGERWLVSYADFVTLLLGVFIILYSMASSDVKEAGGSGEAQANFIAMLAGAFGNESIFEHSGDTMLDLRFAEAQNMEMIKNDIEQMSESMGLADDALEVTIDETGVHIRIKDALLFNSGSATINQTAKPLILKIGDILKKMPNNYIQIDGHTDNVPMGGNPNIPTNWELGSLRAVNILKMLVKESALNPKYLNATSYGEFRPIATNSTPEGRAKNRRVEITLLRNYYSTN